MITLFGPNLLGWAQEGSDLYTLFNMIGDAGFISPIFTAYSASKQFHTSSVLALLLGSLFASSDVYWAGGKRSIVSRLWDSCVDAGICQRDYPSILSIWILSYIELYP